MTQKPRLVIIGGPNGSGKTTQARAMMLEWSLTYLGADQVAEELGLGSTGADAVRAGRAFMARSPRNFWHVYRQQVDRWRLHYNGVEACVMVGQGRGSTIVTLDLPRLQLFERLLEVR